MAPKDAAEWNDEAVRPLRRVEYDRLVELGMLEGEHVELLGGALLVAEPQSPYHVDVVDRLAELFRAHAKGRWRVRDEKPLAISDISEPEPDIALVEPGDYSAAHPTSALLVVEISDSSLHRDRGLKARLYARGDVDEYWVVDVQGGRIEVYRQAELGAWKESFTVEVGGTVSPLAAPELAVDVSVLLPRVARQRIR